jgi:HSP20 family protein
MATLVKQSPFPELESMERRLRRLFEGAPLTSFVPTMLPAADVYETPKEFVVELEVPGYTEKQLEIEVSDHTLTVTGRGEESKEAGKTYRLQERLERTFKREFRLPPETDGEHVTAQFEQGVLEVHAPKLATSKPHKVEISKT